MSRVDLESKDWKDCCTIIDRLEDIGDVDILCNIIRMLCSNSQECTDILIGQYGDELE